jgi:hypothetical protein
MKKILIIIILTLSLYPSEQLETLLNNKLNTGYTFFFNKANSSTHCKNVKIKHSCFIAYLEEYQNLGEIYIPLHNIKTLFINDNLKTIIIKRNF